MFQKPGGDRTRQLVPSGERERRRGVGRPAPRSEPDKTVAGRPLRASRLEGLTRRTTSSSSDHQLGDSLLSLCGARLAAIEVLPFETRTPVT